MKVINVMNGRWPAAARGGMEFNSVGRAIPPGLYRAFQISIKVNAVTVYRLDSTHFLSLIKGQGIATSRDQDYRGDKTRELSALYNSTYYTITIIISHCDIILIQVQH